jgi:hypothetical protein
LRELVGDPITRRSYAHVPRELESKSTDAEARKTPLAFLLRTLFFPIRKCPFAILKVEEDKALCDFVVVIFIV